MNVQRRNQDFYTNGWDWQTFHWWTRSFWLNNMLKT